MMPADTAQLRRLLEIALRDGTWAEVIVALEALKTTAEMEVELAASQAAILRWKSGSRMRPSAEQSMRNMIYEWLEIPNPSARPDPRRQLLDELDRLRAVAKFADHKTVCRLHRRLGSVDCTCGLEAARARLALEPRHDA